ncbi:MAG: MaoC family dehydratase [Rhodoferax sp.]|nr:MaoC family dehydratase [Betaproteobacteria bacterium]NCN98376.1 MaoC family dehydratase [Rhodoferax sp.]OIP21740.1 MAG: dehydratase [Comamonadaceae bacterium CG2_30_57_122]PIZ21613.1 MAG: dehydratase [Comamonadaceae bacterium CG_4_10_14_0_8_um_filter_57_29]PJC22888.1 MAG: dehydratase [Comamonadaceae bacterium CG_4_9_14_0_8_um_filter_57_21]
MKIFNTFEELAAVVGQEVAVTDWVTITQAQVDGFAAATGDTQWIHVDVERARAGPFGGTIAHGFLTLALIPRFFETSIGITPALMAVNCGLNRVRFTAPVLVGSRLRARIRLQHLATLAPQGVQVTWEVVMECEGVIKPVCVAESLARLYP